MVHDEINEDDAEMIDQHKTVISNEAENVIKKLQDDNVKLMEELESLRKTKDDESKKTNNDN